MKNGQGKPKTWAFHPIDTHQKITHSIIYSVVPADLPIDPNEPLYCYCQQVSYGEMVACDNTDVSNAHYLIVLEENLTLFLLVWYWVVPFSLCWLEDSTKR